MCGLVCGSGEYVGERALEAEQVAHDGHPPDGGEAGGALRARVEEEEEAEHQQLQQQHRDEGQVGEGVREVPAEGGEGR